MTPLAYPGDPYGDPDYDEVAILKAEIKRLKARGDQAVAENVRVVSQFAELRSEVERLRIDANALAQGWNEASAEVDRLKAFEWAWWQLSELLREDAANNCPDKYAGTLRAAILQRDDFSPENEP
jgi:hypothetical protein